MSTYTCNICNKSHELFYAIENPKPVLLSEFSEEDLKSRVKQIDNSYIVDGERFLMLGDIFIYKKESQEPLFTWSVWASISFADFISKSEELKERKNVEFSGKLESELPFYGKTRDLNVKVFVNIDYDYAVIKIVDESPIKNDQVEKVSDARVEELMQRYYHPAQ